MVTWETESSVDIHGYGFRMLGSYQQRGSQHSVENRQERGGTRNKHSLLQSVLTNKLITLP